MKILHTSDWHLGKKLNGKDRMEEQVQVMDEIVDIAKENDVDVVLVAGDLFDTFNPPVEAIELLYKTLYRLAENGKRLVVAIAGNHDSPDRIDSPDVLARECGIFFIGNPLTELRINSSDSGLSLVKTDKGFAEFRIPKYNYPLRVLHTPYANGFRLKKFLGVEESDSELRSLLKEHWYSVSNMHCVEEGVNVLVSHLFMANESSSFIPEEPDDERPICIGGADMIYSSCIPENVQYVALGHLHRFQYVCNEKCPVVYSGSPLSYSFNEADQKKYVLIVDLKPTEKAIVNKVRLTSGKPLFKKRFEQMDEAISWLQENQNSWLDLTVVTDYYMTAMENQTLNNIHKGIIHLISEVRDLENIEKEKVSIHNLRSDVYALFTEFFRQRKGHEPNEEIMNLFKEIISHKEN